MADEKKEAEKQVVNAQVKGPPAVRDQFDGLLQAVQDQRKCTKGEALAHLLPVMARATAAEGVPTLVSDLDSITQAINVIEVTASAMATKYDSLGKERDAAAKTTIDGLRSQIQELSEEIADLRKQLAAKDEELGRSIESFREQFELASKYQDQLSRALKTNEQLSEMLNQQKQK